MPITAAAPPPPKTAPKTLRTPKPAASPASKTDERTEGLQGWGQIGQAVLIGVRRYADAGAMGTYFPALARETAKLAATNESVASLIDPLVLAGPYSALIAAALPLALQVAVNHGWMKPGALGTVPPEVLSARIEADIARMQVQALRDQQEAEAEYERLQQEIRNTKAVIPSRTVT